MKLALRGIRATPLLSVAAIVCIALGAGANIAVFQAALGLLARSIPGVHHPDSLVSIHRTYRGSCCSENSYPVYEDLREQTGVFDGVEAHYPLLSVTLNDSAGAARVWGQVVTPEYFGVLGVHLRAGRAFSATESGSVVISHSLWQRRFGADPAIVSTRISLNNRAFVIIGIAPPEFRGADLGSAAELWVPTTSLDEVMPEHPSLQDRSAPWLFLTARLRPGVSLAQARSQLDGLATRLQQQHRSADAARGFLAEPATALHPSYRGAVVNVTLIVSALVGFVLVIACLNVANILLARASGRAKESAIRLALGAGRGRLIRTMVLESAVLAILGGACGMWLSYGALRLITSIRLPISLPVEVKFQTDWRVFLFASLLSLAVGLIFGLWPAVRASRCDLTTALKSGTPSGRRTKWGTRDVLAFVQVSLSVVLLVVMSLFLRSLLNANRADPGFRTRGLLLMDVDPRMLGDATAILERIRTSAEAVPGVISATFTEVAPLGLGSRASGVRRPEDRTSDSPTLRADVFRVGPRYFETLRIPLLKGRDFYAVGESVAGGIVVDRTTAARLWPGEDPTGRSLLRDGRSYQVLGVVGGIKSRAIGEAERPCIYLPLLSASRSEPSPFGFTIVIYTAVEPLSVADAVSQSFRRVEPMLAISNVRTMEQHIGAALLFPRAGAIVFGLFAIIAVVLTSIGLYGVVSYSVTRRTRELGIRVAVGASYRDVLAHVASSSAVAAGGGLVAGLAAAFAGTHVLRALLYGVTPTDAVSFVAAAAVVITASALACYIPARRAALMEPLIALRSE